MKTRRLFNILTLLLISILLIGVDSSTAAAPAKKATTTAKKSTAKKSTAKKSTSKSSVAKKSTAKKPATTKKKTTTKKKSTKKRTKSRSKKRRATSISHKQYVPPVEVPQNDSLTLLVNESVLAWIPEIMNPGGLRVNSVKPDARTSTAKVSLNENFTYLPVTKDLVEGMRREIERMLPDSLSGYRVNLNVGTHSYSYYITTVDKLPEQFREGTYLVRPAEPFVDARKGMQGDIIAMWPSHGRYYKPATDAWLWQRPQLFQVTEDTHTLSYILPYAVPMIENAGGYVMLPKERDTNRNEVIVDNDTNQGGQIFSQPYYKEQTGDRQWVTGEGEGFIYDLPDFRDTENPFENGTYRQTETVTSGRQSAAAWYADIPADGEYAVYVSYKTLPNSTRDARYTVNYSGGSRTFLVDQTMGGGTWIYLGTFPLEGGFSDTEPVVTVTNLSKTAGSVLTADAVKIGGGMGNIARSARRSDIYYEPSTPEILLSDSGNQSGESEIADDTDEESDDSDTEEDSGDDEEGDDDGEGTETETDRTDDSERPAEARPDTVAGKTGASGDIITSPIGKGPAPVFKTSGLPRYLEGARYWLQWAGVPEYIYSPYHGTDDYKDDYTARGHWVNYLAGGSRVLPDKEGLNIPVDAVMALHSDAGKRADDTFVGTLGIYYTNGGDSYVDGTPRTNSRTLTDMLMRQIAGDIRQTWEPNWTRRSMWDKSYVEARVPEVPTSLIEFMSHQNFADMKYALDPSFRFTVGRSIYKAVGRFVAERKDRKFIVQPLPVKDFAIRRQRKGLYRLSWSPTPDRLEPTAEPSRYLVFERTDDELGFHLLGQTTQTTFDVRVEDRDIHSFKIVAANDGGLSFPSEILALRDCGDDSKPVLVLNGFTRVSAPGWFSRDGEAGFDSHDDFGVPYIRDIAFVGYQNEFRRNAGESFGRSDANYADLIIAGNTFDFAYVHGKAISASGLGFVSASVGALVDGRVKLHDYRAVDLILGKQKTTVTGNGNTGFRFNAFPAKLQSELRDYVRNGGDLFVSGAYVITDLLDYRSSDGSHDFARSVLGVTRGEGMRTRSGRLTPGQNGLVRLAGGALPYSNTLNEERYIVENPDILTPSGQLQSEVFIKFGDTGNAAGVASVNGKSRVAVMSVPFESIGNDAEQAALMKSILDFLSK